MRSIPSSYSREIGAVSFVASPIPFLLSEKRVLHTLLLTLLGIVALSFRSWADSRADGGFLRDLKTTYVTPHLDWGIPLAGGPIKILAIVPRNIAAREIVELAQRISIDYQAVAVANSTALAVPSVYEATTLGTSEYEKTEELLEKLNKDYDVIIIANVDFSILPLEAQYKILKKTASGAGLLLTYPKPFPYKKALANPTDGAADIMKMVDPETLPLGAGQGDVNKLLTTYLFDKGRIARIAYPGMAAVGNGQGLTAFEKYSPKGWKARYENNMGLLCRTVQWLAGRPLTPVASPVSGQEPIAGKDWVLRLQIQQAKHPGVLHVRIRDEWNAVKWTAKIPYEKDGEVTDSVPSLASGIHYLDILEEQGGQVLSPGVFSLKVGSLVGSVDVTTDRESYEPDDTVKASVTISKALDVDADVIIRLEDLPDRRIWVEKKEKIAKGTKEVSVSFPAKINPTIAGAITANILVGDKEVAKGERIAYFPRRQLEIYPSILWTSVPQYLSAMYAPQLAKAAHNSIGLSNPGEKGEQARLAALFNQRFIPYLTRIGLKAGENGQTLSEFWLGMSKDEVARETEGDGSIYNPRVKAMWKKTVETRMQGLPEVGPPIYTLGDENHFSYDAGYSPADEIAFKAYLQTRYANIAALNAAWNTDYRDFDAIVHFSPKELREKMIFPLWYEHRRFMEKQYSDVHHYLAECIKAIDPHARVGAEGSIPGELEQTIENLEFWGPYSDAVSNELLRSVGGEKLRSSWWGFGAPNSVYPLWRPLLQGVVNSSAWYSSAIETSGLLSIDFSLADYYAKMKPHLEALENGQAQALISTPLKNDGIAILWSHASQSASVMDERFLKPGDSINVLMNFCYRVGLNFDLVTTKMVENEALKNYRILFLCGASALSEKEVQAITAFVERGGILVADINPGVLNGYCRPLDKSSLSDLFGTPTLHWDTKLGMVPIEIKRKVRNQDLSFRAEKAFSSPTTPIFSVKEKGRGLAILLNFNLGTAENTASVEAPLDQFLSSVFQLAGIKPEIRVEGLSEKDTLIRIRQSTDDQIIGVLAAPKDIGKEMSIQLPKKAWIYEVNRGEVGESNLIKARVENPLNLYSIFATRQKAPALVLDRKETAPGGQVSVATSQLEPLGIYRVELRSPGGDVLPDRTKFFVGKSTGNGEEIRFAFNDQIGEYRLSLTDIRTGLTTEEKVAVRK